MSSSPSLATTFTLPTRFSIGLVERNVRYSALGTHPPATTVAILEYLGLPSRSPPVPPPSEQDSFPEDLDFGA